MTVTPRVLIACEYSGVTRDAFLAAGYDAISCDLLPTESPGPHYEGDVHDLMKQEWDLVIAHPPCTYLAKSGVRWLYEHHDRWQHMITGAVFFRDMFRFQTRRLCVENPVMHHWATDVHGEGSWTQTIQPYQFGHPEVKRSCYWLRNLPLLTDTLNVKDEMESMSKKHTDRVHFAAPGPNRWKVRSTTYPGVAEAMARQWGPLLTKERG